MSKKTKTNIIAVLITFLIIGLSACSIYINIKYPSYKEQKFSINEDVKLNGVKYHVDKVRIFNNENYKETYSSSLTTDPKECFLLVDLSAENITDGKRKIPIDNFRLETEGWSSNIAVDSLLFLNENLKSYSYNLSESECIHLCLPFMFYDDSDKINKESTVENLQFSLCLYMDYPQKISIIF